MNAGRVLTAGMFGKTSGLTQPELDKGGDIAFGARFLEAEQAVRVAAHAAVGMIGRRGGEGAIRRVHPEHAARCDATRPSVRSRRRHRSFKGGDVGGRGVEEGDRDRSSKRVECLGQPFGELRPGRTGGGGAGRHRAIMPDTSAATASRAGRDTGPGELRSRGLGATEPRLTQARPSSALRWKRCAGVRPR